MGDGVGDDVGVGEAIAPYCAPTTIVPGTGFPDVSEPTVSGASR